MPFYRRVGVEQLLFVDPATKDFEVRRSTGEDWAEVGGDEDGWVDLASHGIHLRTHDGRLQCRAGDLLREI